MLYRNTETGVVVDVTSEISGTWERVTAPEPVAVPAETETPKKKKTKKD